MVGQYPTNQPVTIFRGGSEVALCQARTTPAILDAMNKSNNDPRADIAARRRGRARVKAVAISATTASVLATAGLAVALPGIASTQATQGRSHQTTSHSGSSSSGTSKLKSPSTAPTSTQGAPQVSTGGS